jgi:hypothetical protein
MSFLTSEIKKPLYWVLAWVLTFINFVTFIVSRNEFWLTHPGQAWLAASTTEDRTYLASEFERNLSCYTPATCIWRSGGALVSQSLIWLSTSAVNFVAVEVNDEQKTFIILLVGLMWRALCVVLFLISATKLFGGLRFGLAITNCLMFVLGGLPLWTVGKILVNLPIDLSDEIIARASDAFFFMSFQNLIFYDYGFIAIVPLTILALVKIDDISKLSIGILFLIGFLAAAFYEAFVPIIFLSALIFLWRNQRKICFSLVGLILGQLVWTILGALGVRFTEASDPNSQFFTDTSLLGIVRDSGSTGTSTDGSWISITLQLCFICVVAVTAGFLGTMIIGKFRTLPIMTEKTYCAVTTTAYVTAILIVGSFLRPVYLETGRQSIGLTVAVVIYSFAATQNFLAKAQAKRSTASSNSV